MCDLKSIWPNQLAPNSFSKLKRIIFEDCEGFDYVFPISVAKKLRQLQSLDMKRCVIKNIVEESDSSDMTNIYLAQLSVDSCDNMNTIVQPSVLFQNLDELVVSDCHGVVNIITPSRAESLPKLRILSIGSCNKLEEIYGSKNENDAPLREIYFMKLEGLLLVGLPRLTSFCRGNYNFYFQSLRMVQLNACSMMETFCHGKLTTPRLKKVLYEWGSKELWDDDLNTTTRTIFTKRYWARQQNFKIPTSILTPTSAVKNNALFFFFFLLLSFHNTEQDWNSSSELWRYWDMAIIFVLWFLYLHYSFNRSSDCFFFFFFS